MSHPSSPWAKPPNWQKQNLDQNSYASVGVLRDKLEAALLESVTNSMVNGDTENRLLNTTSIAFEYDRGRGDPAADE